MKRGEQPLTTGGPAGEIPTPPSTPLGWKLELMDYPERAFMDSTGKQQATVPEDLRALYGPVARELEEVEVLLRQELSSENPFVDRLARHGFRLGGKRLRPALVLLSAKACGGIRPEHLTLAAMVEVLHTATLVHDDVLDEATIRRHLDTVNARWSNEVSILLGDYLLARAICLASSLDDNFACRAISESARHMCEGELRQIESRGNYDLGEADYFEIIAGKTAALTSCCCGLGAHYAGADVPVCEALSRYGHDIGVAFQIADDVLDLVGEEVTAGKSLGTDLLKQKATLPLIRLLTAVSATERPELMSALSNSENHHRDVLRPWFERYDAIAYAREQARSYTRQACGELAILPRSDASKSLSALAEFVVNRHQ
jgi:octaprenyl-diphosphate synthase